MNSTFKFRCPARPAAVTLTAGLLGLWLLALAAPQARAASLVHNLNETSVSTDLYVGVEHHQGAQFVKRRFATSFTTGANGNAAGNGWTLNHVFGKFSAKVGSPAGFRASIFTDSGGSPGTERVQLSGNAPDTAGDKQYTCSGANCALADNTTYWLVFAAPSGADGNNYYRWKNTTSDNETTQNPSNNGWSIGNDYKRDRNQDGQWGTDTLYSVWGSGQFEVNATAVVPTLTASDSGQTTVTLTIGTYTGTWYYKYSSPAGGTCSAAVTTTTANVTGLTAGGTYTFKAYNDSACATEIASTESFQLLPPDPANLRVTAGVQSLTLNWDASNGASGYQAQWRVSGSSDSWSNRTGITTTSTTISSLMGGTTYEVRVRAYGVGFSQYVSAAGTPGSPVTLTASNVRKTTATLTIANYTGTNWYYKQTAPSGGTCSAAQTGTTASLTSLTANTAYTFKAYSDSTCATEVTSDSTDAEFTTPSGVSLRANNIADTSFRLTAYDVSSYPSLRFKRVSPTEGICRFRNTNSAAVVGWDIGSLSPATTYTYELYAPQGCFSNTKITDVTFTTLATLATLAASAVKETTATLTITGRTTAWWYKGNQAGARCTSVAANTTTASLTGLTGGTSYIYKAYGAAGCNAANLISTAATVSTVGLTAESLAQASATLTIANWTAAWWYQGNQTGAQCTSVAQNVSTASLALTAGTNYIYTAYSAAGCTSANQIADVAFSTPAKVALTASAVKETTATLTLASSHTKAWWYQGNQAGAQCTSVTAGTATAGLTGLTGGTSYIYKAYSKTGCNAADLISTDAAFTTVGLTAGSLTQRTATLTLANWTTAWWHKQTSPAAGTCVPVAANTTTASLTGLTAATDYTWTVYGAAGCSAVNKIADAAFTTTAAVVPPAPTGLTAAAGNEKVTLTWTSGGDGGSAITTWQYVKKAGSANFETTWTNMTGSGASTTSHTVTGLTNGTAYKFKVRAVNSAGNGTESAESSAVTPMLLGVCSRTTQIRDAIVAEFTGKTCGQVTATDLDDITSLSISSQSTLTSLKAGDFDGLTELTSLVLSSNGLTSLPARVFDDLTALNLLFLRNNSSLTSLPAGVFDKLTALTTLNLSNNSLASLPAGAFDKLTAMTTLRLQNNSLATLPAGIFDTPTALESVYLNNNSLTSLRAGVFDELTSLSSLRLNNNSSLTCLPFIPSSVSSPLLDTRTYSACGAGVTMGTAGVTVGQGVASTYTAVLDAYPRGTVTVTPASGATGTATVSGALTFTQSNWSTAQSVTVTGVAPGSTTVSHTVSGGGYGSATAADVAVTVTAGVTLTPSAVKETTATLTIGGHTTAWWYKGDQTNASCAAVAANTASVNLTGLTGGTTYTYKAYSNNTCATELTNDSTDANFSTVGLTAGSITQTGATLTLANWSAAWWHNKTAGPGSATCASVASGTSTASLTGLTLNSNYTWAVYSAANCNNTDKIADVDFSTLALVVPKMAAPTLTGGTRQISMSWSHPDGVSGLQAYRIRYREKGETTWTFADAKSDDGNQNFETHLTSATLPAHETFTMKDGTTYEVQIRAGKWSEGYPGWGAWSDTAEATTLGPTLTASAVEATTATLTIAGHTGNWYHKYTVPDGGACSSAVSTTTANLTGLTPGTSYTYKAYSDSSCGTELATASAFLTKPARVTGVTAATGSTQLAVSWTAVTSATGYTVQWKSGNQNYDSSRQATPTGASHTITGLTNGTQYTLRVKATNGTGDGAWSADATGTPVAATLTASAVEATTATLTIANHTGNWYYKYTTPSSGTCSSAVSTTTASLTGLTAGTSYTFKAYSNSTCGTELATASAFLTKPAQVTGVVVSPGDASLGVSWTALSGTVTGYKVQWKSGMQNYNTTRQNTVTSGTSSTITGLANATAYTVRVTAYNGTGDGTASTEVTGTPSVFCGRTPAVRDGIVALVPGKTVCSSITNTDLAALTNRLNLYSNSISSLKAGDFAGLSGLTSLDLGSNSLSSLPAGIFDPLTALTTLNLDQNSLTALPTGIFDQLTSLTSLSLWTNNLTSLPSGIFDRLTNLTSLDLGANNLSSLPDGIFDQLTNLAGTFYLDSNTYTTLPSDIFENITKVTELWLSNTLTCLPFIPASEANGSVFLDGRSQTGYAACDAGATLSRTSLTVGVGGSKTYTVVLQAHPNRFAANSGNVTVTPASSATATATVSPATLTFTTGNWSTPRTVTVSGVAAGSSTVSHTISGGGYGSVSVDSVAATVTSGNLSTSAVTATTATLTIAGHTGNWYYKYTVPATPAGTCSTQQTGTTASLTGLTAGTSYTFKAYSDSTCATELANAASAEFLTRPAQVTGVSVTADNTQLAVSWTAVTSATGYTVQWKSGDENYGSGRQATPTGTSHTITGLTNGTQYTLRVKATNGTGDGAWSADATGTPATAVTLTASAVEATTATLTIANHTGNWYYKYTTPSSGTCSSAVSTTTANLTGLTPGTSYTYKAYSNSTCGTELATASAFLTKPAQVTNVSAAAGNTQLAVSWTAVTSATGYTVQWKSGNENYESGRQATPTGTSHTITGLTNGTQYTLRVQATNATGDGAWSADATGTPAAVTLTASSVEASTATLTLANHAGTWYHKYTTPSSGTCSSAVSTTTANLTGLTPGTSYTYKAYSDSTCGTELATATAFLTKPGQVTGVSVTGYHQRVEVNWTATTGATGYTVQWKSGNQSFGTDRQATTTNNYYSITGLISGTVYTVQVKATNGTGDGAWSNAATGTANTATLSASSVQTTAATLTLLNWPKDWYYKHTTPPNGTCSTTATMGVVANLTGLTTGTSYTYKAYSDSTCATEVTSATTDAEFLTKPAQVTGVAVSPGDASLGVSWTALSGTVTGYKVQWKSGMQNYNTTRQNTVTSGTSSTITGLTNATAYTVRVTAYNGTGDGTASTEGTGTPSAFCGRTPAVRDGIVALVPGKTVCSSITNTDLAALTGDMDLDSDNISSLKAGDFAGLSSLSRLDLGSNSLSSLPAGIFDPLTALTRLSLDTNNLTTLPAGVFDQLTSLQDLTLWNNNLTSLPSGVFDRLTKLRQLDLGQNSLSSLPAGIFDQLTSIPGPFYLDANTYTTLPSDIFENLTELTALLLSDTLTCLPFIPVSDEDGLVFSDGRSQAGYAACDAGATLSRTSLTVGVGGSKTYTVVLQAHPNRFAANSGNVTVTPASSATGKATVSPATLTFTTGNWSTPRTVTVSGVAAGSSTVSHTISGGGYGSVSVDSVAATVTSGNLSTSAVTATTATLTIAGHTGNWYYKYTVPATPAGTCSTQQTGTTASLTGLTAGTSYTFKAYSDSTCATELANAASAEFLTRPAQVTGVSVTADNTQLAVSWTAVASATGYTVQWKSGNENYESGRQATPTGTSHTITGLTNGTQYTLRVKATNGTGDGAWSADATGTPATAVTLTLAASAVKETTATLTISGHTAAWWYQGNQTNASCAAVAANTTTASLTGLTGGTDYTYKAYSNNTCTTELTTATTDADFSTVGLAATSVMQTGLTLNLSNWTAAWWFKKTAGTGGSLSCTGVSANTPTVTIGGLEAANDYTYAVYSASDCASANKIADVDFTTAVPTLAASNVKETTATLTISGITEAWWYKGDQNGAQCTAVAINTATASLTGLTGGTDYTYKAYSDNTCATELTDASSDAEFSTVGLAAGSITQAGATLTLSNWSAAWWHNKTAGPGSANCTSVAANTTTASLTGLTLNSNYTWAVYSAANCNNTDKIADADFSTLALMVPKMAAPTLTGGTRQISMSWSHPDGVSGLQAYRIRYREKGETTWTFADAKSDDGNQNFETHLTSATLPAYETFTMKDGTTYEVQIRAGKWNEGYPGWGAWSDTAEATTLGPTLTASAVEATTATLTIADHSGNWYHKYTVPDGGACSSAVSTTTASLTGLTPGTSYTWKAYSDSSCGTELTGAATDAEFVTKPAQVTGVTVTPGNVSLSVSWTAVTGATSYTVQWKSDGQQFSAGRQTTSTTTSATITGLTGSTEYTVRVAASTGGGAGAWSATATGTPLSSGVTLSALTPSTVPEGGSATYTVVLTTLPTASVTIAVANRGQTGDDSDLTVNPGSLTFTTSNWNTAQTVTVTARQDSDVANGSAAITHTATSSDNTYNGITIANKTVTEADDDAAGVQVSQTALSVPEGGSATYTVRLATLPTATVTIDLAKQAGGDGNLTFSPPQLSFTTTGWDLPQRVTVSAAQDADATNGTATITHAATSTDTDYSGITIANVTATEDDDELGVTLSKTALTVPEGSSATYTVVLDGQPAANVTITVAKQTGGDASLTVAPASLTFGTGNWNTTQTVTVSAAQDNDDVDGTAVITHTATSTDTDYSGITIANVTATEDDDDLAGVTLSKTSVTVTEGSTTTYTVVLDTQPSASVTIAVAKQPGGDASLTVAPASLTFGTGNWNTTQTVTVSAAQDTDDVDGTAVITHTATSTDSNYGGIAIASMTATEDDDEPPGTAPTSANVTLGVSRDNRTAIPLSNLPFSDEDTGDTLHGVKILTLPGASDGTLGLVKTGVYAASATVLCVGTITPVTAGQEVLNTLSTVLYFCPKDGFNRTTFRFQVIDSQGRGSSQAYTATLVAPPGQVTGLQAEAGSGYVRLSWPDPKNPAITGYEYRQKAGVNNYGAWTAMTGSGATTTAYSVTGLTNATAYTFQMRARSAGGAGPIPSAAVSATPTAGVKPAKPTGLQVVNLGFNTAQTYAKVRLVWDDPKDPSIIRYEAQREFSGLPGTWLKPLDWTSTHVPGSGPATTSAEFEAGSHESTYAFRVRAVNAEGNGPWSDTVSLELDSDGETPVLESVEPGNGRLRLRWSHSGSNLKEEGGIYWGYRTAGTNTELSGTEAGAADRSYVVTGLTNGNTYTYVVYSWGRANADQSGRVELYSNARTVTLPAAPAKPAGLTAKATPSGASLSWTDPKNNVITGWQYRQKAGVGSYGSWTRVPGSTAGTTSASVSELADGTTYTFQVRAVIEYGTALGGTLAGTASDEASTTPVGVVVSKDRLALTEGGAAGTYTVKLSRAPTQTVTITVSVDSDGSVTADTDDGTTGNQDTLTFTTGTWNTAQTVKVKAAEDDDGRDSTATIAHAAASADARYNNLTGLPGLIATVTDNDGVGLTLSKTTLSVTEGGTATYTVRLNSKPSDNVTVRITRDTGGDTDLTVSPGTLTFTGGNSGNYATPQTVTVSAAQDNNDAIDGTATFTHEATGGGYGGVTATLTATETDNDEATLTASSVEATTATLTIANHTGNWYHKYTTPSSGTCSSAAVTTTTANLTGLTPGTSYTYKAYSDSSCGTVLATASAFLTKPAQVTGVSAATGNTQLVVSWTAVPSATGYTVQWKSGNQNYGSGRQATPTGASHTITGLTNGTQYTLRVKASNATGDGAWSADATGTPAAVTLTASSVEATTATLTIANHTGNWYHKYTTPSSGTCSSAAVTTTTANLTGLTPGTSYTYKAYSDSSCGTVLATASAFLTKPAQVTGVSAATGNTQLVVSWTAVPSATGYTVQWKSGNQNYDSSRQATPTGASHTITGLTNGTQYTLRVKASNATGDGAWSADATGTPAAVTLTASSVEATTATLTIANHTGNWYHKYTTPSSGTCSSAAVTTTTANLTGLTPGTSYTYKAYSDSSCGTVLATASAFLTKPAQVTGVTAVVSNTQLAVSWTAVTSATGYTVQWKSGNEEYGSGRQATATGTAHTVTGLSSGTAYTVRVRASNGTGAGAWSADATGTLPQTLEPLTFGSRTIANQTYLQHTAIAALTLPAATGGAAQHTYTLARTSGTPELPLGLTFDPGARELTGTPTAPQGAISYTYTATDANNTTATLIFTITVEADLVPTFGDRTIPTQKYIQHTGNGTLVLPAATGGNPPLTYSLAPKLPEGLTFDPGTRELTGTPTEPQETTRYTYRATDGDGDAATLIFTITVAADLVPTFGDRTIPAQTYIQHQAIAALTLPAATSGNPPLTYSLAPKLPEGLTFTPGTRQLAGTPTTVQGATRYTYTATDLDGDAATVSFTLTVRPAENQAILKDVLAAKGRALLSSATGVIGARFRTPGASSVAGTGLEACLGAADPGAAATDDAGAAAPAPDCSAGVVDAVVQAVLALSGGAGGAPAADNLALADVDETRPRGPRLVDMGAQPEWNWESLVWGRSFALPLKKPGSPGSAWTLWGAGDVQAFQGTPRTGQYDGQVRSLYLGVDAHWAEHWLAGAALARSWGTMDYKAGTGDQAGRLETTLTSVYPYVRGTLGAGLEVWALGGYGWGEVESTRAQQPERRAPRDLRMAMGATGARQPMTEWGGVQLAMVGGAGYLTLGTEAGETLLADLDVGVQRVQVALEAAGEYGGLAPYVQVGGRYDGGDGQRGAGLETVGGFRYTGERLEFEARGRWLALHAADGYQEYGGLARVAVKPRPDGTGLHLAVAPRWGAAEGAGLLGGGEALLAGGAMPGAGLGGAPAATPVLAVESELGYGFAVLDGQGVLTPYGGFAVMGEETRQYRLGGRLGVAGWLNLSLEGTRQEGTGPQPANQGVQLQLEGRF